MGLPTRNLDDRTFQDIVDEAKRRIAATCPGWTDHNVSDPGITLVELFAWMTEMILYRLNQVPDKNYIKFMELLGLRLREAEPARTEVTFYLSAPQPDSVSIPQGTEVATVRTETRPAIVFTTDEELEIRPPGLAAVITRAVQDKEGDKPKFVRHNIAQFGVSGFQFNAFGTPPSIGDALYLAFESDLSKHVLALQATCDTAVGMGIDVTNPPWQWEGWYGGEGDDRWLPAIVEEDGTGGMNQSGVIRLRLPHLAQRQIGNFRGYWVRCRVVPPVVEGGEYEKSPVLRGIDARSMGGSVPATHAAIFRGEVLGRSDGAPGQVFFVEHSPILTRAKGETIAVRQNGEETAQLWTEVVDFSRSSGRDKHFTLDSRTGEVRFGPALRQLDGSVRSYGDIPARGAEIQFIAYRHGGGVEGNVQANTLTVLKTSIPYIDRVTNHMDATGGLDPETIEMAQMRAPELLRTRGRAVTPEDFEALARAADSRIQRARCVQPLAEGTKGEKLAGNVFLLLVPRVHQSGSYIPPDQLKIKKEIQEAVAKYLEEYRLLTVRLDIREPQYLWVSVDVSVCVADNANPERARLEVEQALYRYLNPITGGPQGEGWPFGRDLYPSDIYRCLQPISGIEFIDSLKLYVHENGAEPKEIEGSLPVPSHGLLASAEHHVQVV